MGLPLTILIIDRQILAWIKCKIPESVEPINLISWNISATLIVFDRGIWILISIIKMPGAPVWEEMKTCGRFEMVMSIPFLAIAIIYIVLLLTMTYHSNYGSFCLSFIW